MATRKRISKSKKGSRGTRGKRTQKGGMFESLANIFGLSQNSGQNDNKDQPSYHNNDSSSSNQQGGKRRRKKKCKK